MLRITERGLAKLLANPEVGKQVPQKLIPREYLVKYDVRNLWKLNLDSYWRLTYTLKGNKVELFAIVLEVMNHKNYDGKFGYHT